MVGRYPNRRLFVVLISTVLVLTVARGPAEADSGFSDAPAGHVFEAPITWLHTESITHGCDPPANTHFCPDETVTRGQMAAFLTRALSLTEGGDTNRFSDDDDSIFEADINRIAAAGITMGCDPPANTHFCPDEAVTRGQMAAFLWRASGRPPALSGNLMVAAGDIALCDLDTDDQVGLLVDEIFEDEDGVVAVLGDVVQVDGAPWEYEECYDPVWGRQKARTRPAAGNHDYRTEDATGYFDYFGSAAGEPGEGWYAYTFSSWRVIVLNSNCDAIGGCDAGSPQEQWLRAELAAHPAACSVVYMHHPRFSSGSHGDADAVEPLWEALYEHGVDVALAGHDHDYERFAPMAADGTVDVESGIRSFVVGTGGAPLRTLDPTRPGSEYGFDDYHGVLELRLGDGSYTYRFVDVDGIERDAGSGVCH